MPFQDASFELVTIVNSLHHVADMRAALAEMVRVVTPGGRIVVQDYLADEDPARAEVWERVERLRDPDHRRLPRPGEVPGLLAEHGFGEDEAQTWTASWSLDDWLEMAQPPYAAEVEIRRLVASDRFELTAWRARFTAR
jgi:SAM-dependent methyltransferase